MKKIGVAGEASAVAVFIKKIDTKKYNCVFMATDIHNGKNKIKNFTERFRDTLETKNISGLKLYSLNNLSGVKTGVLQEVEQFFVIGGASEQKRTDYAMRLLDKNIPKEKIYMVEGSEYDKFVPIMNIKPSIRYIEYHVTDFCNLKCKGCGHMAHKVKKLDFANLDEYKIMMQRMADLFCNIEQLRLMGGEPLLCKNLEDYIDIAHDIFPNCSIKVVSNGLLYKKISERLIHSMKNCDVELQVTQYPPTVKIKDELEAFCKIKGIRLSVSVPVKKFKRSVYVEKKPPVEVVWKNCPNRWCHFIKGTTLYACTAVWVKYQFSDQLGWEGLTKQQMETSVIDLIAEKDAWEIIKKIENPFYVCNTCSPKREFYKWENEGGYA